MTPPNSMMTRGMKPHPEDCSRTLPAVCSFWVARAKRLGIFAERALPNPVGLDSSMAYYVFNLAISNTVPKEADYCYWWNTMRTMGIKFGDIVILDAFAVAVWKDANPLLTNSPPHMTLPFVPPLSENKRLGMAIMARKKFLEMVDVPVLVNIMGPHPRYLNKQCCEECMPIWDAATSPK